jgi:hypothetical protein
MQKKHRICFGIVKLTAKNAKGAKIIAALLCVLCELCGDLFATVDKLIVGYSGRMAEFGGDG